VLIFHLLLLLGVTGWWTLTPLYRGGEAVLLFFMLSGFVLTLPFMRGPVPVGPFLLRRVCRIWLPYLAVLALVLGWHAGFVAVTGWPWPLPGWPLVASHVLLVGVFDTHAINGVIWSLVHELRVSLIFPLVARAALGPRPALALGGAALVSAAGLVGYRLSQVGGAPNDLFMTAHYLLLFVVGALLARHRERLLAGWAALGRAGRTAALAGAGLAYVGAGPLAEAWLADASVARQALHHGLVGAACVAFLLAALAPGHVQRALGLAANRFLGRVSYSLYLVHLPVLAALHGQLGLRGPAFVVGAIALSLALAWAGERWVERPAIALGRHLAGRLAPATASAPRA
jgi:peptidoglycan/LPS O-acetylase OafA/YrhL